MTTTLIQFVHLVSVGTSILRNTYNKIKVSNATVPYESYLQGYDEDEINNLKNILGYCSDPSIMNDLKCGSLLHHGSTARRILETLLFNEPFNMSAELNAMSHFIELRRDSCIVKELDEVILYHTDTNAGRISAELISEFLKSACNIKVSIKQVNGLGSFNRLFEGLSNLVREVYCDIEKYRREGAVILLNLTGGFKPELGAFLLAGSLAGASAAYYIHEVARRPVFIPIVRVKPVYDPESIARVAEILAISKTVRPEEIPGYAWILYVSEAIGLGRRLADGSYELDRKRARYLAEYIKRLSSTESCG